MTPIQASKKAIEKLVYTNLQDRRVKQLPKFKLGDLVKASDIRFVFSEGDSTSYSYKLYTKPKSFMILLLAIELTIYPRDIMKIFYFLLNYLLMKTIKL